MNGPPSNRLRCCSAEHAFCCVFHRDGRTIAGAGAGYRCIMARPWAIQARDMTNLIRRSNEGERLFVLCCVSGSLHRGVIISSHSWSATHEAGASQLVWSEVLSRLLHASSLWRRCDFWDPYVSLLHKRSENRWLCCYNRNTRQPLHTINSSSHNLNQRRILVLTNINKII